MNDKAPLQMAGYTDAGRVRTENEDTIGIRPEVGLAILADGMGGHQAGEVASGMAVDIITRHFINAFARQLEQPDDKPGDITPEINTVYDAIQLANSAIYEMAHGRPEYAGMGSTVVVVVFYENSMCVGHAGDSRLYRFRSAKLEQLTQDHSVIQELVSRGLLSLEEARQSIGKNLVTRALGVDPTVTPDVNEQATEDSDIYLLCSDGLNDMVPDAEIERILTEHGANLEEAARRLVAEANEQGGVDNISVILVRTGKRFIRGKKAVRELHSQLNQV
jgi:protein phosphatase